jgi:glucokinase
MENTVWLGIDIGGTKTAVLISKEPPEVLWREQFLTCPEKGPEYALDLIIGKSRELLARLSIEKKSLRGIGVSCGNPMDRLAGIIQSPPNLVTWKNVPIKTIMEREFGARCLLENDANAGAVAEFRFGAGRGCQNMVFLTMGTGLGAGLILDGRLFRGTNNYAGEVGHIRLTPAGPVGYNKAGSVEGWGSGGGMAQVAAMRLAEAQARGETSLLSEYSADGQPLTALHVGKAAERGDRLAQAIIRSTGERLGELLALLVDLLNPERILIGGLALRLGDALLNPAREVMIREALPQSSPLCQVVPAGLGERIGDLAALCVAMGF